MKVPARYAKLPIFLVCALAIGIPTASAVAYETETVPTKVEAVPWAPFPFLHQKKEAEGQTFSFLIESGYCIGEPKPELHHVEVVERPKTKARLFKSTVITTFLRYPEHLKAIPPPDTEDVKYDACLGLGLDFRKRIKLKRPVHGLFIYDGDSSPPRRIWPRVGS